MTARPFSRLEPVSDPKDPAREIAAFFGLISGIGAIPAAYWTVILAMMVIGAFAEAKIAGGFGLLGVLAYALLGFTQLRFYFRRMCGGMRAQARGWWLSTYFFNVIPLGVCGWTFAQSPHIGSLIGVMWFAVLCSLAVVAYASEERRMRAGRAA